MALCRYYQLSIPCHRSILHFELQQKRQLGLYRRYENFLEKRYPKVYRMHRLIVDGCRSCGSDIKNYYVIRRDLNNGSRSVADLGQTELFSYIQTNQEIVKLLSVFIIASLPFAFYGIAVSVVFFPRYVLTRHFWTDNQKETFWHQNYMKSYKPQIQALEGFTCPTYTKKIPIPINEFKSINMPDLNDIDIKHLFYLFRLHNISIFSGTNGLKKHARLLAQLDSTMVTKPASIDSLSDIELKNHLYVRRLDFSGKSSEEMKELLRDWTSNLKYLSHDPTLYLHAPVMLKKSSVDQN